MNATINELVKSIVKKNSLAECSVSELQRLTTQYPYFGPVQFLLARKLKEDNSPLYGKQSQKAILYFYDQLWFDFVTSTKDNTAVITHGMLRDKGEKESVQREEIVEQANVDVPPTLETIEVKEEMILPVSSDQLHENHEQVENLLRDKEEKESVGQKEIAEQVNADIPPTVETIEAKEEMILPVISDQLHESSEYPENLNQEQIPEAIHVDAALPREIVTEAPEEKIIEPVIAQQVYENTYQSTDSDNEEGSETEETNQQMPELPALKIQPLDAEAKLTFEPYHTIDYFASQGVRFKEEEKPKDKFGQQLKSFTEWLKAMKRLPAETETTQPVVTEDKKVTQLAEHSLADREVVTEAMADVWEQQGNREKAIETYRKLSLLNPAKSAYFAAKIDHLKRQ